jgi:hypothetical protein
VSNSNDPTRPEASQPPRRLPPQQPVQSDVRIRRAPKLPAFLIVGGGLGAVITFILTALFPVDPEVGFFALFGYFALYGVTAGVVVGGLVAIILDRRADKRSTTGSAVVESALSAPASAQAASAAEPELPAEPERAPESQPDRGPEPQA